MSRTGLAAAVAVASCLLAGSVSAQSNQQPNQQLRLHLIHAFAGIGYNGTAAVKLDGRQMAEAALVVHGNESSGEKLDALSRIVRN